ncbi:MAG: hypothetical protein JW811_03355 [Clostridiales bacterium]|nr:hypothetical protein [Clostridiales bacterium]
MKRPGRSAALYFAFPPAMVYYTKRYAVLNKNGAEHLLPQDIFQVRRDNGAAVRITGDLQ